MSDQQPELSQPQPDKSKTAKSMPDAFVILFFVVILAALSTHILPAGKFDLAPAVDGGKPLLVADSYQVVEDYEGVPLFGEGGSIGFFNFAFEGMVSGDKWGAAVGVMMFIILTGGAFGIIMQTGAINNGVLALIRKTQRLEFLFIPILFVLFSLGGAIFGMGEEAIAFCIVLLPLMKAIGYDGITTVMATYVATQIGFATSWMNPFSVAIAQGIAGVPLMSGMGFRIGMWVVFTVVGLIFTMRYAAKIKRQSADAQGGEPNKAIAFDYTKVDSVIIALFFAGIIWVIWGVLARGYYIPELASQFFTLGCVIGLFAVLSGRSKVNEVADAFKKGAQDLLPAAMIVGMAKGIVIIMGGDDATSPSVLNTVLHSAGQVVGDLPQALSALFMLLFQAVFNFFIASGSGQAALTMPLMAPLSDLVGVTRQVAVLAFQLGDGLTNIIIPTSASLIGCLGVAKIDWLVWARFIFKFMVLMMVMAAAFVVFAVMIKFS